MNGLSLRFSNPQLEALFQKENLSSQSKLFSNFLLFQSFFLIFLIVTTAYKDRHNYDHILIFSLTFGFLIFLWIIRLRYSRFFQIGLKLFFFFFGLVLTEFSLILKADVDSVFSPESVAFIIPIQSFCSLILLVRLNWIVASFFYLFNMVYFLLRMLDIGTHWSQSYIWVGLLMGVINFSYMGFREQKIYRELFKTNHESYENVNLFHLLLRNVIPSSIFILNIWKEQKEIKFINNPGLRLINKTLDKENVFHGSGLGEILENLSKEKQKNLPGREIDINKIREFFASMDILDQKFENCQNDLIKLLLNQFDPKETTQCSHEGNEVHFLSLNLSKTVKVGKRRGERNRNIGEKTTFSQNSEIDNLLKPVENDQSDTFKLHSSFDDSEFRVKYYELKVAQIHWNDELCHLLVLSDITKSKKIIELKNLDKHKNQLLATISHDLRTPLNGVIGMINATLNELQENKVRDFLKVALRSANLLDFLIKDILDFSQISYKKLRLNIEEFEIKTVIQEVFSLMRFQVNSKPICFELESILPEKLVCRSDPNRIKQILINLMSNAIKFTKEGFVRLSAEYKCENPPRNRLKLTVIDSGIGIRKEDQSKLFRLFGKLTQEDPEINKYAIGLGLAISNNLAKLLDSSSEDSGLHVESTYGKGSVFWFYVDVGSVSSPGKKLIYSKMESSPKINIDKALELGFVCEIGRQKMRVLIVDDDLINLYVLEKYLEAFNCDVSKAMNGVEAFEFVEREFSKGGNTLGLILMDCNMPLMNGIEATENIFQLLDKKNQKRVPIVGISANDSQEEVDKCLKAGMMKLIVKPIKKEEFCNIIGGIFKNYE